MTPVGEYRRVIAAIFHGATGESMAISQCAFLLRFWVIFI
ncbi:hypothetical protein D083_0215 [Dickeya solani RNS 08.23.3.1.A]|nr:hypothetical protein D083_0215 [Dickeya solani RNS 08.23.3.1.A]